MYLVDSIVWMALSIEDHEHHGVAIDWLSSVSEPASILFCRATQQTFLRLITTAATVARYGYQPKTNHQAWSEYDALFGDTRVAFQDREPRGLEALWKEHAGRRTASPKLWMDAYLAAFALAGGYQLVTIDAAFTQFEGLDLMLLGSPSP